MRISLQILLISLPLILFSQYGIFAGGNLVDISAQDKAILRSVSPAEASFRIRVGNSAGTCVGIHKRLAVTNAHVVGHHLATNVIITHTLSHQTFKGDVVACDSSADVAIILIHKNEKSLPYVMICPDLTINQQVSMYGYGSDNILKHGSGKVLSSSGYTSSSTHQIPVIESSIRSVAGDSGSGIFNTSGQLVALNWGSAPPKRSSVSVSAFYVLETAQAFINHEYPEVEQTEGKGAARDEFRILLENQ